MANFESEGSVHEKLTELERLVEIWKILGISHMNFESITDLITQQLVGLRALGDNEIRGTSMNNRNYNEHWEILDALLEKMISFLSDLYFVDTTSDLRCLESLEEWVALSFEMKKYPEVSSHSCTSLDDVLSMRLNTLWEVFDKGLVVKDDACSIRVLKIAAKLRVMLHSQFHHSIDTIIAQKLRILMIRQAGKSDPSLKSIVQSVQEASTLLEAQDDVHQDSKDQDVEDHDDLDAADVVNIVDLPNLIVSQQEVHAIAEVHSQDEESSIHQPQSLDSQIKDLKDSHAKIKEELRQKTEAYKEGKAYARFLYNELVDERLYDLTKAIKKHELSEDKEASNKQLREAKSTIERAKLDQPSRRFRHCSHEGTVTANEQKDDLSTSPSHVPRGLRHILPPETVDNLWPKDLQDEKDGSATSFGDLTPASSNGSMAPDSYENV